MRWPLRYTAITVEGGRLVRRKTWRRQVRLREQLWPDDGEPVRVLGPAPELQLEDVVEVKVCDVYWGSHGCRFERGHKGPHWCDCCECESHPDDDSGCVAGPPYYGFLRTTFYGNGRTRWERARSALSEWRSRLTPTRVALRRLKREYQKTQKNRPAN